MPESDTPRRSATIGGILKPVVHMIGLSAATRLGPSRRTFCADLPKADIGLRPKNVGTIGRSGTAPFEIAGGMAGVPGAEPLGRLFSNLQSPFAEGAARMGFGQPNGLAAASQ